MPHRHTYTLCLATYQNTHIHTKTNASLNTSSVLSFERLIDRSKIKYMSQSKRIRAMIHIHQGMNHIRIVIHALCVYFLLVVVRYILSICLCVQHIQVSAFQRIPRIQCEFSSMFVRLVCYFCEKCLSLMWQTLCPYNVSVTHRICMTFNKSTFALLRW